MPIPDGYNADECSYFTAIYDIQNTGIAGGNNGVSPLFGFGISVDENRKVTVSQSYISTGSAKKSVASYLVFGRKTSDFLIPQIKY